MGRPRNSSGLLCREGCFDVSEERAAPIFWVTELGSDPPGTPRHTGRNNLDVYPFNNTCQENLKTCTTHTFQGMYV
jgi:hypothetical protein